MSAVSYRTLFEHRWKHLWRSGSKRMRILKGLIVGGFVAYVSFALAVTGYALPEIMLYIGQPPTTVPLLNEYLFLLALFLLPSRFLLQRSLKLDFRPYLTLPISHRKLVRFAQGAGLFSLFNIIPFAFIVPFWGRIIAPDVPLLAALAWLIATFLLVFITHFITEGLRLLHLRFRRAFRATTALLILGIAVDMGLGFGYLGMISTATFSGLLRGELLWLLPLLVVCGALAFGTATLLRIHLKHGAIPTQRRPYSFSPAFFDKVNGPTSRLLLLDWTLILRNRRPRRSLTLALIFSVLNAPVMLTPQFGNEILMAALAAGFALILLPSSYGQYLFSWDSQHYDAFLAWPIKASHIVRSRAIMLMLLAFGIFLVVMPFFYWLAPQHLLLLVCFLLYVLGIATPVLLFVGLWNYKRLHLSKGAVLNYEGLSAKQFLVNLPIFIPPIAILVFLPLETALWTLSGLGLFGLASAPIWSRTFAHILKSRKYRMAVGFRSLGS